MGRFEKILIALGVLSPIVLAAPELGTIAFFSIVGIPIAIAYWAVPALLILIP